MILFILFGNILFGVFSLIEPIFFREIIDTLIAIDPKDADQDTSGLLNVVFFWIGLAVVFLGLRTYLSYLADKMSHIGYVQSRQRFFEHVCHLSMRHHGSTHSGKTLKNFTRGSEAIFWLRLEFYRLLLPNIILIIILIPLIIYLNLGLASILLISSALFLVIALPVLVKANKDQQILEKEYTKESSIVGDVFSNIAVVKSFSRVKTEIANIKNLQNEILKTQIPILYWWAILTVLSRISATVIMVAIFYFGGLLYLKEAATIGEIVMFVGFASLLLNKLEEMMWQIQTIFWRIHAVSDFYEILDTMPEITDRSSAKEMASIAGEVRFQNVSFAYEKHKHALRNIALEVKAGEKIALVGHTGAGKSTFAQLLLRFYEPTGGKITIDGYDIQTVTQDSLRANIGIVFQENFLFHSTVEENIKIGKPNATEQEIIAAAKQASAWGFIENLPNGLQTIVGERGVKLSGGEKQRLAIARVILKNPPILILDEATSALDAITELELQNALNEVMQNRTTFIIAHRLSTIRKADRILVLEDGKIIEQGSYKQLIENKGVFGNLIKAQRTGFE